MPRPSTKGVKVDGIQTKKRRVKLEGAVGSYYLTVKTKAAGCMEMLISLSLGKVAQSCPTLCDPRTVGHGILQARTLEWVAFPFSRGSSQPSD